MSEQIKCWAVKKDESHPMWRKLFCRIDQTGRDWEYYHNNPWDVYLPFAGHDSEVQRFKGYPLITIDQACELLGIK